jgi:hypothetical protein
MSYVPPVYTPEEIIASLKAHAARWRREAELADQPEGAAACLDYALHLETMMELERLRSLD